MTEEEITGIIEENNRRKLRLASLYNPVTGEGSPLERFKLSYFGGGQFWTYSVPIQMYKDHKPFFDTLMEVGSIEDLVKLKGINPSPLAISGFINELTTLRFKYDFEFWAYLTARIQDKATKRIIPFKLNKPQLKVLAELEKMRVAGEPIRAIILKARQWGGSTLIQIYMAWIQIIHKKNWHSVIIADIEDQARNIRGMYSRFAKEYPDVFGKIEFVPFEGSAKNRMLLGRNCIVGVGSAQKPENLRSYDFAMCHLSEVASYKTTLQRSPEDLVQSTRASIPDVPLSLEVLESTAKGVGNFFHREWLAAINRESAYEPIFISWFEIPRYQKSIVNYRLFIRNHFDSEYVQFLWNLGATLEGINWYLRFKKGKNYSDWRMNNEFPSTAAEAFSSSDMRVFDPKYVLQARESCIDPEFIGDISAKSQKGKEAFERIEFMPNSRGNFFIWSKPDKSVNVSDRYVVSVDIGGRTDNADYSVIKVIDRYWMIYGGGPETVATWRGHCFIPGTLIYTSEGLKKIEDVKIGDLVWTHKNRFRKVIKTYKNEYDGEVISIRSKGNYETITCTPEHPFYGNNVTKERIKKPWKKNRSRYPLVEVIKDPEWIQAQDLKYITYSKIKQDLITNSFIINKYNGGKSKHTTREITDHKSFFSILGYYLAEGHLNRRSKDHKIAHITFSFSYHERNTVARDCYDKLIKLGFKSSIIEYKDVGVCRVRANDTFLAQLIFKLCGEHSWEKKISPLVLASSTELLSELLDSYWKGDGSVYKSDQTTLNTITTVSPILARQIRDILILLGKRPGIYRVIAKTKGKGIKSSRPRYNVVWNASKIKKYATLQNDKSLVYRVNSKIQSTYTGAVYNLEVEEDNSYSTACYVVHNCDQDLIAWKAAQIARWYNNALLVVESNSLDKDAETEGTHFLTILDEIVNFYSNIYARTDPEKVRQGLPIKYGFQTTLSTKPMVIDILNAALRDDAYIERDIRACDEMDTYEIKPNGTMGAVDSCHDDIVMATAIGLWACFKYLALPKNITYTQGPVSKKIVSEATI